MLKKLGYYAGEYKKNGYNAVFLLFGSVICEVVAYYFVYIIIEHIVKKASSFEEILPYVVGVFLSYILKAVSFSVGLDQSHICAFRTLCNIRKELAKKLKKVSLGEISSKGPGVYRQKFVDDIESIELLLAHGIPEGLPYAFSSISVLIVIFIIDYRMGLLSLVTLPIGFLAMGGMVKSGTKKSEQYRNSLEKMNKTIVEYVAGMEVVKVFNKTNDSSRKMEEALNEYKIFTKDWYATSYNYMAIYQSVIPSTILAMLPVGMIILKNGNIDFSTLLFTIILALSISGPLVKIMNFFPMLYNVNKKIEKVEEEFALEEIKVGSRDNEIASSEIEFQNVTFSYDKVEVLQNVSFKVKAKEKIGIVGESGSGKSTIGKLIMHYWNVDSGSIKIGGVDINEMSLGKLMEQISYVSQNNFLFNISILDNLLIAKPNATKDEIIAACKAARCHNVIMQLTNGYDTVVGESGNKLSGGERQRITIARAILKNAPIVILDEATSFTDAENDAEITKAIHSLSKNKTLLTIAHKLSNIKEMDRILLMDQGNFIACDTHENLLENTIYHGLWERYIKTTSYEFTIRDTEDRKVERKNV